jgi:hypothetical protein
VQMDNNDPSFKKMNIIFLSMKKIKKLIVFNYLSHKCAIIKFNLYFGLHDNDKIIYVSLYISKLQFLSDFFIFM